MSDMFENNSNDYSSNDNGYINAGSSGNNMANEYSSYSSDAGSSYQNSSSFYQDAESRRAERRADYSYDHIPEEPAKNKNPKVKGLLKRAGAIVLSAALFGGVAGGTLVGIQYGAQKAGLVASLDEADKPTLNVSNAATGGENASYGNAAVGDVSSIVEKVLPSVVSITNTQVYQSYYNDPFSYFFGFGGKNQTQEREVTGSGSGIIIGQTKGELLIVTNHHVIDAAKSLTVTFIDDKTASAYVKGYDSENDLAVVAVKAEDIDAETEKAISIAALHTDNDLKVGQGVIAIGNALGYGQSITVGYISALDRTVADSDGSSRKLLQTDAAINPGNSGGALINANGEIIGINSAKYSDTSVEGMGFAIPISAVNDIIENLMTQEPRVEVAAEKRGYFGIQGVSVDNSNPLMADMPTGVYVYSILEGGAAAESDLQEEDIVTAIDGHKVENMGKMQDELKYHAVGDTIKVTVSRKNPSSKEYETKEISITLKGQVAEQNKNSRY